MNVNVSQEDLEELAADGYTPAPLLDAWLRYHEDRNIILNKGVIAAYKKALGEEAMDELNQAAPGWYILFYDPRGRGQLICEPEEVGFFLESWKAAVKTNPQLKKGGFDGDARAWHKLLSFRDFRWRGIETNTIVDLLDKVEYLGEIEYVYHSKRRGKRVLNDAQIELFRNGSIALMVARALVERGVSDADIVTICKPVSGSLSISNPWSIHGRVVKNLDILGKSGISLADLDLETVGHMPGLSMNWITAIPEGTNGNERLGHVRAFGRVCKRVAEQGVLCGSSIHGWFGVRDALLGRSFKDRKFIEELDNLSDTQLAVAVVMAEDRYHDYDNKSGRQLPVSKKWFLNNAKAMV